VRLNFLSFTVSFIERLNLSLFAAYFRQRVALEARTNAAARDHEITIAIRNGYSRTAKR